MTKILSITTFSLALLVLPLSANAGIFEGKIIGKAYDSKNLKEYKVQSNGEKFKLKLVGTAAELKPNQKVKVLDGKLVGNVIKADNIAIMTN